LISQLINMRLYILNSISDFPWSLLTSIIAIVVSITALYINRRMAQKNIRLSIQQLIFKTISEKVKDCNSIWEQECTPNSPNTKLISEIIISREIIDKSFDLFESNYSSIRKFQENFYKLFWTQLRTDLRSYIIKNTETIARSEKPVYQKQVEDIRRWFTKFYKDSAFE